MASNHNFDTNLPDDHSPDDTISETISTTGSDVTSQTLDDSMDDIPIEPALFEISSPGTSRKAVAQLLGQEIAPDVDNVNLNISVKVNNTTLKGSKVKDDSGHKEQTIDVSPHLGVKAVAKDDGKKASEKDKNYTIDLQFTINMDKVKKGKGQKGHRRRHKSDSESKYSEKDPDKGESDENDDCDLGEGAVGGHLSDVIPEEPEIPSGTGTPRGGRDNSGRLSPGSAKKLGVDYHSGYDSGYFDYGRILQRQTEEEIENEERRLERQSSGSGEDGTGSPSGEADDKQGNYEKSKRKSKSYIRKERAKRLKDKLEQTSSKLVLRRNSSADVQEGPALKGQSGVKAPRRYSISAAGEELNASSEEDALDGVDTDKLDTLIMLNKIRNFLQKNMPAMKVKKSKQAEAQTALNGRPDLGNEGLNNPELVVTCGQDLDTSFTTEDGEHSGEVTPRNRTDTEEEDLAQRTPRNASPTLEPRVEATRAEQALEKQLDLSKQGVERKTRLTRQSAREEYAGIGLENSPSQLSGPDMKLSRSSTGAQMQSIPSIEVSNELDETVTLLKGHGKPRMQRAKSESAVSQGLLAPYCKIKPGSAADSDEVFTLSSPTRSPRVLRKHGKTRHETLKMDAGGHPKAEIVLDCDHPDKLLPEEIGIELAEDEELRVLPVLVLDAEPNDTEGDTENAEVKPNPNRFAPIGIIPLEEEKAPMTEEQLKTLTENAEEILKDTERGAIFNPGSTPNYTVGKPKAPSNEKTKVLMRSKTEAQASRPRSLTLQSAEEPARSVTMRSPGLSRRAMSECGSPRNSPRISRKEMYKEFFEPTRRITRHPDELCSPIEKAHHDVMENLDSLQFQKHLQGEDISGLGGYHKDFKKFLNRSPSRDSIGSDSSSGGSKEEQPKPVFVFPPSPMQLRNNLRSDSDDTASISSGSGIGMGSTILERRKSLEDKMKQDGDNVKMRHAQPTRSLNFSNYRTSFERRQSDDSDTTPVLDAQRARKNSDPKIGKLERPHEYTGIKSKFEKLIAGDGMSSPTLSRKTDSGSLMRKSQFSKTLDGTRNAESDKKPQQSWTWKQRDLERSKSESATPGNNNNSNSRTRSLPSRRADDEWFMPSFEQTPKEKEKKTRDVSPFRNENTDWFFSADITPQTGGTTLAVPGSPDARQRRNKWSESAQKQDKKDSPREAKITLREKKEEPITKSKVSLNMNNNARKSWENDTEQDMLFLTRSEQRNAPQSPITPRRSSPQSPVAPRRSSPQSPVAPRKTKSGENYGLTIQAKGMQSKPKSDDSNYGLTLQTTARPRSRTLSQSSDDVFMDYAASPNSPTLSQSPAQANPFKDYKPVGRHKPIVLEGRVPPRPPPPTQAASASPKMSKSVSQDATRSRSRPQGRSKTFQQPRPQMSRSTPSQGSVSGLHMRAIANSTRQSPRDCQDNFQSLTSVDSGWYSERLDSTISDVFDIQDQDGYTSDTTETPGSRFFPLYTNGLDDVVDDVSQETPREIPLDSALNQLLDENDDYASDDELFRQRCIDVFKTLHHEDVVYQQFQKLLRFRNRRISLHKDNFKIIPPKDERSDRDSDSDVAYLV